MITSFLEYITLEKRCSALTAEAYKNDLAHFEAYLLEVYGNEIAQNLQNLKPAHIKSWLVFLLENGISRRSVSRKLSALKSYCRYLHRNGQLKTNPAALVAPPKFPKPLPKFVETDKMQQLFQLEDIFANDINGRRDYLLLALLYTTGMRRAEILQLTCESLNLSNNTLRVVGKGNKQRVVPLLPNIIIPLKEYLQLCQAHFFNQNNLNQPLLLNDDGRALTPYHVARITKKYLSLVTTAAQKSPHVLRHTFATHLLNEGADINAIKELLGHSSLAATQVYTHNSIEKIKKQYKQAHPKG